MMKRTTKRRDDAGDDVPPSAKEPRPAVSTKSETRPEDIEKKADEASQMQLANTRGVALQNVQDALQNVQDALQHAQDAPQNLQDAPQNLQDDLQNVQDILQNVRASLQNVEASTQPKTKTADDQQNQPSTSSGFRRNVPCNEKVIALICERDPPVSRLIEIFPTLKIDIRSPYDDLSELRTHACLVVVNNMAYVIGGLVDGNLTNTVKCLNLESNENKKRWSLATHMKVARSHHACAVLNGKIYAAGGKTEENSSIGGKSCTVEVYEPGKDDTWTLIEPMHDCRCQHSMVAFKDELFVFGGIGNKPRLHFPSKYVEKFSPEPPNWIELKKELGEGRISGAAICFNDKIWLIGGKSTQAQKAGRTCLEFNGEVPTDKKIGKLHLGRDEVSAVVHDNHLYITGKSTVAESSAIEQFTPNTNKWDPLAMRLCQNKGGIIYSNCLAVFKPNDNLRPPTSSAN